MKGSELQLSVNFCNCSTEEITKVLPVCPVFDDGVRFEGCSPNSSKRMGTIGLSNNIGKVHL
jgi:hypothetical protein